jgi:hypothetical protein
MGYTHGLSKKDGKVAPTYATWKDMKQRCFNTKHKDYYQYGGRGITICEEWFKFENFYNDMGEKPEGLTLDRNNVNNNYCKENCRWASIFEQNNNKTNTVYYTFKDETLTLAQWGLRFKISRRLLRQRLNTQKWSMEDALTLPKRSRAKKKI